MLNSTLAQKQFLHDHTIEEITSKLAKAVVYVDTETSLEETCKMLGKNDISAVPILDVNSNSFIGMIDIVDIAFFISHTYEQRKITTGMLHFHLFPFFCLIFFSSLFLLSPSLPSSSPYFAFRIGNCT